MLAKELFVQHVIAAFTTGMSALLFLFASQVDLNGCFDSKTLSSMGGGDSTIHGTT
jgi:hypothetical protein